MKKTISLFCTLLMIFTLCSCSSSPKETTPSTTNSDAKEIAVFPDFFVTAADHVGVSDYDTCLQLVKDAGLQYDTTAPSNEDIGKISLPGSDGFTLNMTFYLENSNSDKEILTFLTYSDGSYEGSVSYSALSGDKTFSTYDVNADPKNVDVKNVDKIVSFITNEVPLRKEEYNNSVQDNTEIEVSIDVSYEIKNGKVFFTVNSNLPDETELMLTLSSDDSYGQATVTLSNGTATSDGFTNKGEPLSGTYTLDVTMSLPKLQSEKVTSVIGINGEFMTGPYVVKSSFGDSNVVEASFSFDF